MQLISPELTAILKSRLQAGPDGFRARIEVDAISTVAAVVVQAVASESLVTDITAVTIATPTAGNLLVAMGVGRGTHDHAEGCENDGNAAGWTQVAGSPVLNLDGCPLVVFTKRAVGDESIVYISPGANGNDGAGAVFEVAGGQVADIVLGSGAGPGPSTTPFTTGDMGGIYALVIGAFNFTADDASHDYDGTPDAGVTEVADGSIGTLWKPGYWWGYKANASSFGGTWNHWNPYVSISLGISGSAVTTHSYQAKRVSIDKSLRMVADQAEAEFANEDLPLGWGPTSVFPTNSRCRIFQWYGDQENEVRSFTGLIDLVTDARDILTTTIAVRDMMAILIDQTFGATAPQGVDEDGAVRTMANGVYLSMEISDIVTDILDRAGWPTEDRAITETSYVLDEYVIADGTTWADAIIGEAVLTGLVGHSAWADEFGVFHFAPTLTGGAITAPGVPVYTFRSGEDVTALDDATDQYDLRTRVKIRGPLTTQTLTDTWRELWRTSKFAHPVGIWYDPTDSANLRVIDSGTKRIYTVRQSDRAVLTLSYLGTVIPYPVGLSGDPSDSTIYWVLNCPWFFTGATTGNSVKKVRKSDNVVLASYALPNGRWTAVKVSAAYLWLTNYDTDRFYSRSKADGSAVADYSHTYGSVVQVNPTGIMVDGTTLYLFWRNAGTTARFLVCSESAPGTITKAVLTAGTQLVGGEMDTTTHTECFGDSNALGLVAKFTLVDVASMTTEVYAEAVDTALEDELGSLAQSGNREHDTHPTDADHPFEVRRDTVDVTVVTSLAQATETAMRRLEILSKRHRVLDAGILGNPALQKTDLVRVEDPVTGIATDFTIDTYRAEMADTYLGTLALIPVDVPTDTPTDTGDAT